MPLTPDQVEAIKVIAPRMPLIIAGLAALRKIALLACQIGGKESDEYSEAQGVARKAFGTGFTPSSNWGSTKGGPPQDD